MTTPQIRAETEAAAKAAIEAGDNLTAGKLLTKLIYIYRYIGTANGVNGWVAAASAGLKAIELLRQCDDELALARALRATSNVHFVSGIDQEALANEAMQIVQRLGDSDEIAWSLLRESRLALLKGEDSLTPIHEALERFEATDNAYGQAIALESLAIQHQKGKERLLSLRRAIALFPEEEDAVRASKMALSLCHRLLGLQEQRKMAKRALNHYRKTHQRELAALTYRRLKKINSR